MVARVDCHVWVPVGFGRMCSCIGSPGEAEQESLCASLIMEDTVVKEPQNPTCTPVISAPELKKYNVTSMQADEL